MTKDFQRLPKTYLRVAQDGPGWPRKLPGCLKEVNIFDLALGAT